MGGRCTIKSAAFVVFFGPLLASFAAPGAPGEDRARVTVECSRASGLIAISIENHRKIGSVHMEMKDSSGRTVYVEEGKAYSDELVRRLDKGMFPKGEATITVVARDFSITQAFVIQ
ncbi:MAG: hypothetical protein KDC00_07445 [Flavobacteriales bacterium]|nr:hypothetical protein [Flavobacteriales bacterium]